MENICVATCTTALSHMSLALVIPPFMPSVMPGAATGDKPGRMTADNTSLGMERRKQKHEALFA